jgi:transcriptional regulator PpsR
LSDLAPELASTVVRVAGDIALVIGDDGRISTLAEGALALQGDGEGWVGRAWSDTVDASARQKIELLLQEAQAHGVSRRRELNHPSPGGADIPVSWAAVRLGAHGPVLAVGRDLRAVSAIQQRFIDTQQELERVYWQRRQAESRYQQLFQVANDAVLVLDAQSFQVLEANPAAGSLLGAPVEALSGHTLRGHIDQALQPTLDELLVTARATGHAAEVRLRVAGPGTPIDMSATPFRADEQHCLLLRARRAEASANDPQAVLDFMGQTPDAVVVTDSAGRVLWANRAFVEMCEASDERRLKGRPLADALGGEPLQWASLLARVRSRGIIGQTHVALRVPGAPPLLASVSAALLAEGDQEHIGFTLRPAGEAAALPAAADVLAADIRGLGARLGQLSLEQLLAQASRMAELHFIQAALRAAGGRLDAASRTLAVSPRVLLHRMHELGLPSPLPAGSHDGPTQVN